MRPAKGLFYMFLLDILEIDSGKNLAKFER